MTAAVSDTHRSLATIEKELNAANEELKAAHTAEATANRARCAATNKVNGLQKEFDAKLEQMHRLAPRDSSWHSTHVRGIGVSV
jgi:hypothetical protein